MLIPKIVMDLF